MFRSASRQIVKALPRSRILTSRPVHTTPVPRPPSPVPRPGPPGYDTVHQRLSSLPDPRAFFIGQRNEEAQSRGEYIDIHDISKNPKDYDVLISDIDHKVLGTTISKDLGIPYLSKATEADAQQVVEVGEGYIHGSTFRAIAPFVVCYKGEARWVFFIVDSGAPMTYLSNQVIDPSTCERWKRLLTSLDKPTSWYQGRTTRMLLRLVDIRRMCICHRQALTSPVPISSVATSMLHTRSFWRWITGIVS